MMIKTIQDASEKRLIARGVLEALPAWFGIKPAREAYINDSAGMPFFAAFDGEKPVGFITLKETGKDTAEIYVMGVLEEYHRRGVGKMLLIKAKDAATQKGYSFIQVKTVQMGKYPEYDKTNRFYRAVGFKEFEVLPDLWDAQNPCQIYVMWVG